MWTRSVIALLVVGAAVPARAQPAPASTTASQPPAAPQTPLTVAELRKVTLADAERSALALQPQVLAARAQLRSAEGVTEQAKAPLLPQVTGAAQYTRETGNFAPRPGAVPSAAAGGAATPATSLTRSYDYWSFGVTGTQLIYDFGQTYERFRGAGQTEQAQRDTEKAVRLQVLAAVRSAYFVARGDKDLVAVARETLADQERHLIQVQAFVQAGTQPAIALAQQRSAVATARVEVVIAQNTYDTAKTQLNQAAGIRGGTDYDVADETMPPVEGEDDPLDALLAKALAARPEMLSYARQRGAQEATIASARGGYGPTFSASAGLGAAGTSLDGLVGNWNAGLLLSWPVFQGGLTVAQIHQAEAGLSNVQALEASEVLAVQAQVDSARLAVRAAKESLGAAGDALASSNDQLRLAEQRYATGVGSIIELNDAQVSHTSAAAQLVLARYGLASARAQLLAALGRP